MHHKDTNISGVIVFSVFVGALIGAGMALLFAPQSGRKTRRKIGDIAEDAKEYATDSAKKMKKKLS
jgi:gas vesicle protein